ncbi:hypothetical protein NG43_21660, partial [Winslowiella iniecta]
ATDALRQRLGTIRRIGLSGGAEAAGREMAAERQILSHDQRMAIIDDPQEMNHQVHKLNPHLISSNHTHGRFTSRLRAEYHPDKWIIWSMLRSPDARFYMSDLVEYQYQRVAREQGFFGVMPDRIEQRMVLNPQTKIITANKEGDELKQVFLTQTPNGELMQRLGNIFGYRFTYIEKRGNGVDYITHIDNGL